MNIFIFKFPFNLERSKRTNNRSFGIVKDLMDDRFYSNINSIEAPQVEILKRQYAENLNIKDPY